MSKVELSHLPQRSSNPRNRSHSPAHRQATRPSARWAIAATICTIAVTTSRDLAAHCEYEEVAYLLIHGKLPNNIELTAYKTSLVPLRSLPAAVKQALELLPPTTHPMDVLRTGVSVLGCARPESEDHNETGARAIADALLASLGLDACSIGTTMRATDGASKWSRAANRSRSIFCTCCMASSLRRSGWRPCRHR